MPRYAPLPSVSIDPRNEAELVQQASQRVYEASNQTLNDFSAGNPLAALLEGQAFAQGEFLFWANQLPQSILVEWLGPFLGAMRRLGTPAVAQLVLTIPPSDVPVTIPAGSPFTTDPNLTNGESITFVNPVLATIPAGESSIRISVASQYVGNDYNCPAFAITGSSAINVDGLVVANPQPAVGGSNVETYQETQERFFTLIRRKNPVSAEDWQDFFIDLYGIGTLTSVQPNRPSQGFYNYLTDHLLPNGQISFFVLGPNGTELTVEQLQRGQNVVNFSVPVENKGHLYPVTLSQVQYNISLEIDANGAFGVNARETSLNFRDRLFQVLQPGNIFPITTDPTVSDVDAAFNSSFPANQRFIDPHIKISSAYNTPLFLDPDAATYTNVYTFKPTEYLLNQYDLVETTLPTNLFYSVQTSFTPYSIKKADQTVYNNLQLQQIVSLVPGDYTQGQVGYWDPANGGDGELHVVLENLTIGSQSEVAALLTQGKLSPAMVYSPWVVGNAYQATISGGFYSPEIVQYDYAANEFIPSSPVTLTKRPGAFVWVVAQNFTLLPATNNLTGAQTQFKLSFTAVTPQELISGNSYAAGTWVFTPQVGSGPNPVADPYYNYVDIRKGVINKYAYVLANFTYQPNAPSETVSTYFDTLVEQAIIKEIIVQNGDAGLPIYKYKPRFPVGTYLEYKPDSASSSEYYVAASYFTPTSTDSQTLVNQDLIFPLYINSAQKTEFLTYLQGLSPIQPTRMFRFWKGDRTFFRQGSQVLSYTATTNITPLFNFAIYLQNGAFVLTEKYNAPSFSTEGYIPYFNPAYTIYSEDTVLAEDGRNLYRVMRAFTPSPTITNWTNTTVINTARIQEYAGNLLRYVDQYVCEEAILSQLGRDISAIKLGIAQITLIPKNKGRFTNDQENLVYVWENAATIQETPELSWFTGTTYQFNPPDYGTGTLKL
jgi:hypothetical protein